MTEAEKYRFTHPRELSEEEKMNRQRSQYTLLIEWKILPKWLTFEQWKQDGFPLNYPKE
ncbi:hypothetical protein P261_02642 [Lachnospiraceae bacterium TWA4]|nr:hypothetical protein P261_02642 [Lachnospiraceae bacterium TWA4]